MSSYKASQFLAAEPVHVTQVAMFAPSTPADVTIDGARFLKGGYIETDTALFDEQLWAGTKHLIVDATPAVAMTWGNPVIAYFKGYYYVTNGANVLRSADLVTWDTVHSGGFQRVAFAANDTALVVVCQNGQIYRTVDGITWSSRSTGTSENFNDVCVKGSMFLAVARNGVRCTSSDNGETWTSGVVNSAVDFYTVTATNDGFVIGGRELSTPNKSFLYTSVNGTTFVISPFPTLIAGSAPNSGALASDGQRIIWSLDSSLYYSDDFGANWKKLHQLSLKQTTFRKIIYADGYWFCLGQPGGDYYAAISTDGLTWQNVLSTTGLGFHSVIYDGTRFVMSGYKSDFGVRGIIGVTNPEPFAGSLFESQTDGYAQYVRIS